MFLNTLYYVFLVLLRYSQIYIFLQNILFTYHLFESINVMYVPILQYWNIFKSFNKMLTNKKIVDLQDYKLDIYAKCK